MNKTTIKTCDAIGPVLDWLVAKCEGIELIYRDEHLRIVPIPGEYASPYAWSPTYDWSQGGPIIERERITVRPRTGSEWFTAWKDDLGGCYVWVGGEYQTYLIAGMRCYVTSKLGDTVEVPSELLQS